MKLTENEKVLVDDSVLDIFNLRVDELADENDIEGMQEFISTFDMFTPVFKDDLREAEFHYMLGNAYSLLNVPQLKEWFSPDLNKVVIHFKKALSLLKKGNIDDIYQITLESKISTNLGNYLSQQGRFMCAKKFWQRGILLDNQPIAHTAMYQSEMVVAACLNNDQSKACYHYYLAYQSLLNRLELPNDPIQFNDSYLIFDDERTSRFKRWFEETFNENEFDQFYHHYDDGDLTEAEVEYLAWCSDNDLFIDELEIDELRLARHPDSLTLPPISSQINQTLSRHEELVYHANFDEIKNDFCYARHLVFTALNTDNDEQSFFNRTFQKVDDMTYSIDNIKAQNLKSGFKILYSLFDKIAYFINHFYDLNEIKKDRQINFDSLFKKLDSKQKWQPHPKLAESKNHFLHALFYILKDLRDIKDQESVSDWLNPELTKICEIRNFIEHRSFKIIDSLYEDLISTDRVNQVHVKLLIEEMEQYRNELKVLFPKIKQQEGTESHQKLVEQQKKLEEKIVHVENKLNEKEKRSKHTLMMTDKDFTTQLMTLAKLVRNSIIYLAFSINYEEQNKPKNDDDFVWEREVPTK
ncbi:LA2681 family HEPN domain-containing protein [Photobacterium leiognathi]|uniref:LA2681 family HEPN domain-containing protein n=1 Tax=Photobacterium leiognathi TaxID=553611 RepID=UPI001C636E58|nr:LA2681 family HEPN domain-containing protein [Photobacterium leiognathi]